MPQHIATWNPTTQLWETDQIYLFSGRSEPYSATFPTSGMTRSGRLLPLPMSGHRIGGNECSSSLVLFHTPYTMPDAPNAGSNTRSKPAGLGNQVAALLPTPAACNPNDGEGPETWLARLEVVKARVKNGNGIGMPLTIAGQLMNLE